MNFVDMKINYGVRSTQVALKPRVNGRNLAETQVFLCPTDERLSGVGVIQDLFTGKIPAVSIDGFKTPGNLESAILEKQWSLIMKTALKNPTEVTYQYNKAYDLVTETLGRMTFLLESAPNNYTDQNFSRDGLSGMGWIIGDMVDRLQAAETILKKLANIKEVRS